MSKTIQIRNVPESLRRKLSRPGPSARGEAQRGAGGFDRPPHAPIPGAFSCRVYVALAEALDAPLVTRDRRLAAAAGNRARVDVV